MLSLINSVASTFKNQVYATYVYTFLDKLERGELDPKGKPKRRKQKTIAQPPVMQVKSPYLGMMGASGQRFANVGYNTSGPAPDQPF